MNTGNWIEYGIFTGYYNPKIEPQAKQERALSLMMNLGSANFNSDGGGGGGGDCGHIRRKGVKRHTYGEPSILLKVIYLLHAMPQICFSPWSPQAIHDHTKEPIH